MCRIVLQVATEAPKFRENTSGERRAATHQMLGPDAGRTMWTVCIVEVPTGAEADVWRAVTGWLATDEEAAWYGRQT